MRGFGHFLLLAAAPLHAAVQLPYILADHMVVQRDAPVHIWGKADPGEAVAVSFRGAARRATADPGGYWSIYLPPGGAGGPFELSVQGRNTVVLKDVLVGDVWIAAGQSNMEWPVSRAANPESEIAAAGFPTVRLARTMHRISDVPMENWAGHQWTPCSPESVRQFSAVAYHFGRLLYERLKVPVGLIQTAWGGTPAEAWTSLGGIASDPALMPVFAEWDLLARRDPQGRSWKSAPVYASASPWKPAGIFNAMVAPLTGYAIRGVIWYQGESNTPPNRAPLYGRLFQALIRDWRRAWGQGDFPFLFVQLANYTAPENDWPEVREGQRQALGLANTAMAVCIDIGEAENIHPKDKMTVAQRLALAARATAYGEAVEHSGPAVRQVTADEGALRVWFDHAGGLAAKGSGVKGFEIAGADRRFVAGDAIIEGETVLVRHEAVRRPVFIRYGWADNPDCNLYNGAGLPASPFRWP